MKRDIVTYLCTPLAGGMRLGTIALQGKRDCLKVSVPGSYLVLTVEDVKYLQELLPDVVHRKDKGWIERSGLTQADVVELIGGEGALREEDLTPEELSEAMADPHSKCWFEEVSYEEPSRQLLLSEVDEAVESFLSKFTSAGHPFNFVCDLSKMISESISDIDIWLWPEQFNQNRDAVKACIERALQKVGAGCLSVEAGEFEAEETDWTVCIKAGGMPEDVVKATERKSSKATRRSPQNSVKK